MGVLAAIAGKRFLDRKDDKDDDRKDAQRRAAAASEKATKLEEQLNAQRALVARREPSIVKSTTGRELLV